MLASIYRIKHVSAQTGGYIRIEYIEIHEVGGAADEDRIVNDHFQLDLSAKFRVLPHTRLFAEWINVTNAPNYAFQNLAGSQRLLRYEKYNRTAKFGVMASF